MEHRQVLTSQAGVAGRDVCREANKESTQKFSVLPERTGTIVGVNVEGILIPMDIRESAPQNRPRTEAVEIESKRSADLLRFAQSVQQAQEDERRRISRELHDGICQKLSCMKMNAEIIDDQTRRKTKNLSRTFKSLAQQCDDMIDEIRRMSANLRPSHLDDFGIVISLELLAREFLKEYGIKVELETGGSIRVDVDPQIEIAVYRISQEALNNIAKHARASKVTISFHKTGDVVNLRIADNGSGFDQDDAAFRQNPKHGLGLVGMRERVRLFGGTFVITSAPNQGTCIGVTLPFANDSEAPMIERTVSNRDRA